MNAKTFVLYLFFSLLLLPTYSAQAQDDGPKPNNQEIQLLIDSLGKALNRSYIYPDKAALMISSVKKNYKSGAYNKAADRTYLGRQLHNDVQQAYKDKHLEIVYDPRLARDIETPRDDTASNRRAYEQGLREARENNFAFRKTELLPGNIGYLRLEGFYEFVDEAGPTLNAAFQFVRNCRALIIDMRNNSGGSPAMVLQTQSYFFKEKTRMNDIIDRNNNIEERWADPAATPFQLDMPVYILTSRQTFSGGEDFTYGLKCAKRVMVVGDTTGGGAHPTRPFSIGQGFVAFIPTHRSPNIATQTDWDESGIWPDVVVPSAQALAKAQALIFTALLTNATDDREKATLQGNVDCLNNKIRFAGQVQQDSIKIAAEELLKYCGEYNPADINTSRTTIFITSNGNHIFRHMANSAEDIRLIPVAAGKFLYGDDSGRAIDFVTDNNGKVLSMILLSQDGVFTKIKKQ